GAGGVFRSYVDSPGRWETVGTGLPRALVSDIRYDRTDDVLSVGTIGRGAFRADTFAQMGFLQVESDTPSQDHTIRLVANPNDPSRVDVYVNNTTSTPTASFAIANLTNIVVNGYGGNDLLILDFTNGNFLPAGGVSFDGGDGADRVCVVGGNFAS